MNEEIQAGDLVQLKSGGPVMTVQYCYIATEDGRITASCSWFDCHHSYVTTEHFAVFALKKVKE